MQLIRLNSTPRLFLPFIFFIFFVILSREALCEANDLIKSYDEKNNPDVLTVKGDALYFMGAFEHSLVNYHRALRHVSSKVSPSHVKLVVTM